MAANTVSIFPRIGQISWGTVTTANIAKDGTGTVVTVYTADVTNGSRIDNVVVRAIGTNVATVLRIFINNGSSNTVATNNILFLETTIASTTLSEVSALANTLIPLNLVLPAGYKINVTIGTTVAAGLSVTATGGTY